MGMKIVDPRDGHGYRLINEIEFNGRLANMPTYEDIRLINSQENIKKLEILNDIPKESVAFTNDYNSLYNLPDLSVEESIVESTKPVQSSAIYNEFKNVKTVLEYTKNLAESNSESAYTNSEYYGQKTFYATTKFGFMTIKPISYERVEIATPEMLVIKAKPLFLDVDEIRLNENYRYATLKDLENDLVALKERVEELEGKITEIDALGERVNSLDERIKVIESDYVKHSEISDFVNHAEMEEAIKRHIQFDTTDVVEKDNKALVSSGGVWNAIQEIDTMQELHPYREILLYIAKKRKQLEYDVLHLLCSKMPRLMAVIMQVEIRESNGLRFVSEEGLTPEDWENLREVVDVRGKLFDFLSRIEIKTETGEDIRDLPLETGLELTEREVHDLKEFLPYKETLMVMLAAGKRTLNTL